MKSVFKKTVLAAFCVCLLSLWIYSAAENNSVEASSEPDAAKIYKKYCASCHASDGSGKSFRGKLVKAKNLTNSDWQADVTDEQIFDVIKSGKRKMPAYSKKLSEDEINSLVKFIRDFAK